MLPGGAPLTVDLLCIAGRLDAGAGCLWAVLETVVDVFLALFSFAHAVKLIGAVVLFWRRFRPIFAWGFMDSPIILRSYSGMLFLQFPSSCIPATTVPTDTLFTRLRCGAAFDPGAIFSRHGQC